MRVYLVWIDGQKSSTQHLYRAASGFAARRDTAAYYTVASRTGRVYATGDIVSSWLQGDELKLAESYLGYRE